MDPKALAAAKVRLKRAQKAVAALDTAIALADMHSAWWTFLLAADGIYSKLEQGAKGNGKSEPWFGKVKHLRKTDPLLCYIHQARNSERHGIDDSSFTAVTATPTTHPDVEIIQSLDPNNPTTANLTIKVSKAIPARTPIAGLASGIALRAVTNRGATFLVPTHHLGQQLKDNTMQEVARAGLRYLESLVDEADRL
jgi:hypothetical protein